MTSRRTGAATARITTSGWWTFTTSLTNRSRRQAQALDLMAIKSERQPAARPDASLGVPPAPRNPLGNLRSGSRSKDWDRERGFVKPVSEFPVADLYICWNEKAVYLGLYAQDIVEENYYRNKIVPEIDRASWIVSIGETNMPIHARLGPGAPPICDEPGCAHRQFVRRVHEHTKHRRHGVAREIVRKRAVQSGRHDSI